MFSRCTFHRIGCFHSVKYFRCHKTLFSMNGHFSARGLWPKNWPLIFPRESGALITFFVGALGERLFLIIAASIKILFQFLFWSKRLPDPHLYFYDVGSKLKKLKNDDPELLEKNSQLSLITIIKRSFQRRRRRRCCRRRHCRRRRCCRRRCCRRRCRCRSDGGRKTSINYLERQRTFSDWSKEEIFSGWSCQLSRWKKRW